MFRVGFVLLVCALTIVVAFPDEVPVLGGVSKLSGDDLKNAEKELESSLVKLSAGDGPHYTIGKVISATKQVVSGTLTKYEVELIDNKKATKKCKVSIWSQSWLKDGIEVTFNCDGDDELKKRHSA